MTTTETTSYSPPQTPPTINSNYNYFSQPKSGFGFSNFRVETTLPDSVNRTTDTLQFQQVQQYTNPVEELEYLRNSNFLYRDKYKDFKYVNEKEPPEDYVYWDVIKNYQERNPLLDLFFSRKNLNHLQKLLISMVEYISEGAYKISRQDDTELLVVMRWAYMSAPTNPYAKGDEFIHQICTLNKNVLSYIVPNVLIQIQSYLGFVRDNGYNVNPPIRPEYMSSAGTRVNRGFDSNFI